ncbi:MAG: hypothetical protein GW859_02920 [Sphingomonadales bacterium]|nr:hypothetical protein [Sphingomonadales bacterium]
MDEPRRHVVDVDRLPVGFPTHRHPSDFWQALGRAVATFGFLEETLGKAIFSFTAMRSYPDDQIQEAYLGWLKTLEHALSDPLGNLTDSYGKVVRDHGDASIENLDELIADLRAAAVVRNVICHGSWGMPDDSGRSLPLFVNKRIEKFKTPIDTAYLEQLQRHTAELACAVINTVTHMGWQFPGSSGPGDPIFRRS